MKFHINSDTNRVGKCSAKIRCRFGGDSGMENHFETREEAQGFAEKRLEKEYGSTISNAKRKKSASKSNSINDLMLLNAELETLKEENYKIHQSIKKELDENAQKRERVKEQTEAIILNIIEKDGLKALTNDVDKAAAIYSASWSEGSGSMKVSKALNKVFEDVPYISQGFNGHTVSSNDNNKAVDRFSVGIPRGAEKDKMKKLSETMEKVFEIEEKVMGDEKDKVSIGVTEDSLSEYGSYSIRKNQDGQFYISKIVYGSERSVTDKTHGKLYGAVEELADRQITYRATEEYEQNNPGWDDNDDNEYDW